LARISKCIIAGSGNGAEAILLITGFLILVMFYMAYRLNRDEGIIVMLQERVNGLEDLLQSVPNENVEKNSEQ